ncbi:MAG: tRNA uracil 4-sulfurtransferase ThiI [bacterium]
MKKIIIIKYGELSTKKDNMSYFLKILKNNISKSLSSIENNITYDYGRMFIETTEFDIALDKLRKVFGIHEINVGYMLDTNDLTTIKEEVVNNLKEKSFTTFKVETKRNYKNYPMLSMDVSREVGGHILRNIDNIKVDVRTPELLVNVEIRNNASVFYFEKIKGLGGYPVGTQGKSLLMLSGGIDSPVAGYLAIKRGISIECIYFDSPPHTSQKAKDKVFALANTLKDYDPNIGVYTINFTKIQEEILKNIPHEYLVTIMRRMMYRITERLANRKRMHTIINGESIGQVASQTLTSMKAINCVVKMPVIRPVACFDKLEIIDISKKINTYDISIQPFEDCCTVFVPKHPVINPVISLCEEYEALIDVDNLIKEAVDNVEYTKVFEENYDDLL